MVKKNRSGILMSNPVEQKSEPEFFSLEKIKAVFLTDSMLAIIALLIARIIMSFTPILLRLSNNEIGPNASVFCREAVGLIFFGALGGVSAIRSDGTTQEQKPYNARVLLLLVAMTTVATCSIISFTWSVSQTRISSFAIIESLNPLFAVLGGWLLFGKLFDSRFLIGTGIAIAGIITFGLDDFSHGAVQMYGDLNALGTAIFYGIYLLLVEQLRVELNTIRILLLPCASTVVLLLPILLITGDRFFPVSLQGWLLVIALGLLDKVLAQGLTVYCLKKLSSGFVALTMLLLPVFSSIEARAIFSEQLNWLNFLGFAIVLVGMYLAISSSQGAIKE